MNAGAARLLDGNTDRLSLESGAQLGDSIMEGVGLLFQRARFGIGAAGGVKTDDVPLIGPIQSDTRR